MDKFDFTRRIYVHEKTPLGRKTGQRARERIFALHVTKGLKSRVLKGLLYQLGKKIDNLTEDWEKDLKSLHKREHPNGWWRDEKGVSGI